MYKFRAALVGLLCLAVISGCSTNTSPGNVVFTTQATLQLAVGSINDTAGVLESLESGGAPGVASQWLDAIVTFRNQNGTSAFLHPGQAQLTPGSGACNFTTGVGCNAAGQFGVGLFGYGQNPGFNGTTAQAPAWGAPNSPTGYLFDVNLGTFPPLGAAGTQYSLQDQVVVNGQVQTYSAASTLHNPIAILAAGSGAYAATAGTGGGTFNFGACVAGATEQVAVFLTAPPPFAGVASMAEAVCPAVSAVIPAGTLAAGTYQCFVVEADFPWVEAGMKNSPAVAPPNPVIVGANGNADLSSSNFAPCTQT